MIRSINEIGFSELRTASKAPAIISDGQTLFTITGGPILARFLVGFCVTANDATASTVTFNADGTVGAATAITGTSASLTNAAAGAAIGCPFSTIATAPSVVANGVGVFGHSTGVLCPEGIITVTVAVGPTTGTWKWYLQYEPLSDNVVVS